MNLSYIFPTPIWQDTLSCDLYSIGTFINSTKNSDAGTIISNINGWQSKSYSSEELMESPICQFITILQKKIKVCFEDFGSNKNPAISNLWFNINPPGSCNSSHIHTDSFLSGVFYVKSPSNCGDIIFERQPHEQYILGSYIRNSTNISSAAQWKFTPKPNMLLVFPSWLSHHVGINNSQLTRISISFNILQI